MRKNGGDIADHAIVAYARAWRPRRWRGPKSHIFPTLVRRQALRLFGVLLQCPVPV